MMIASYVLLGLLSCVEALAGETAFDRAVEAYRTYKKAQHAYFEARDAHEETRLAWSAYLATDVSDREASKKAMAAFDKAKDANKEVKGAYAIFQITGKAASEAVDEIEEVKLALAAFEKADRAVKDAQDAWFNAKGPREAYYQAILNEAHAAFDEASDTYLTVREVFNEAIKKAYKRGKRYSR